MSSLSCSSSELYSFFTTSFIYFSSSKKLKRRIRKLWCVFWGVSILLQGFLQRPVSPLGEPPAVRHLKKPPIRPLKINPESNSVANSPGVRNSSVMFSSHSSRWWGNLEFRENVRKREADGKIENRLGKKERRVSERRRARRWCESKYQLSPIWRLAVYYWYLQTVCRFDQARAFSWISACRNNLSSSCLSGLFSAFFFSLFFSIYVHVLFFSHSSSSCVPYFHLLFPADFKLSYPWSSQRRRWKMKSFFFFFCVFFSRSIFRTCLLIRAARGRAILLVITFFFQEEGSISCPWESWCGKVHIRPTLRFNR